MNEPDNLAQTVAVTGGTGFVGRKIIETLLARGINVRTLARSIEKANRVLPVDRIEDGSITICQGTLDDPDALRHLGDGCQACIHLVGIIREQRGATFENVHIDGTRAITQACIQSNPSMRYIHMSALGIGPDKRAKYRDTKHRAEQIVRNSKLHSTIIRPGLIHGPHGEFTQMAIDWVTGKAPPYLFLPYFSRWKSSGFGFQAPSIAPVYVDDVAHVFVDAISKPNTIGKVYDLSGSQQLPFPEMLRIYARHLDPIPKEKPAVGLPWFIASLQARIAGWVGLGGLLPYDEGMAIMGGRDSVSDNAEVIADFGFTPAEFESALGMYADQL